MINPNEILNYMRVYSNSEFSVGMIAQKFDIPSTEAREALDKLADQKKVIRYANIGFFSYKYLEQ